MTDASPAAAAPETAAPAAPAYPTVDLTVTVPQAENDMVQAIVGLVKSVKAADAAGFSLSSVPTIVLQNLAALKTAVSEASVLPAEVKSAPTKLGIVLAIGLDEILG